MGSSTFEAARSASWRVVVAAAAITPLLIIGNSGFAGTERFSWLREGPSASNHPVHVVPSASIKIPNGWPVAPDGSITCKTCHISVPAMNSAADANLRGEGRGDAQVFCAQCHRDNGSRSASSMHWQAMPRAHWWSDSADRSAERDFDRAARSCLECHDGVTASDAGHETPQSRSMGFVGDRSRNHPVGVAYPPMGTRGVEVPLRPAAQLPRSVRLPRGKVGCVSCHDLYSRDNDHLTVPIEGSRLCMTCHVMD